MDSNTGGQSSSDLQRRAAAEIARKKVLAAYAAKAKKSTAPVPQPEASHLKDVPIDPKINSESWKKYHSAWQDYYQKYYSEYYSNAAKNYIAKERLKDAREQAEEDEIVGAIARAGGKSTASGLKMSIQKKATDSAKKTRRFRKFIPLLAGIAVVLLILFLQYNRLIFAPIMAYVSPGNAPASEIEALDPTITQVVSDESRLIIPKLNIDVPVDMDVRYTDVMASMNVGVAHYRISGADAYPGEIGNFIITGHSAGDVYSSSPYKYIFSGLERLDAGDLIYMNYKSVRYTYQVTKKEVVEPSNVAALIVQTDKPLITLVTCTPLGTSRYRLLVTGEQISPVWDEDAKNEEDAGQATPVVDETTELPSNEPSFFERIWSWLTGRN